MECDVSSPNDDALDVNNAEVRSSADPPQTLRWIQERSALGFAELQEALRCRHVPLVEPGAVTFVYLGSAEAIYLRRFIYGQRDGVPFKRLDGRDVWYCRLPVADGTRIEYKFDIVRNGNSEWINDPLNPHIASDPFGANSVCRAYGYRQPSWSLPSDQADVGTIVDDVLASKKFNGPRHIRIYLPPEVASDDGYPLLIMHDGTDFMTYADFQVVLDNLIHQVAIPPVIVALTQSPSREIEYAGDARHAAYIVDELIPFMRQRYPLSPGRDSLILGGASLGAVASLSTAWRYPGLFGSLILKSGSFVLERKMLSTRGKIFARIARHTSEIMRQPRDIAHRVFVSSGVNECLISQNRLLEARLRKQGLETCFLETLDGHHWHNWRDQMREALAFTLPAITGSR